MKKTFFYAFFVMIAMTVFSCMNRTNNVVGEVTEDTTSVVVDTTAVDNIVVTVDTVAADSVI